MSDMRHVPRHLRFVAMPLVPLERQVLEALQSGDFVCPHGEEEKPNVFPVVSFMCAMEKDGLLSLNVSETAATFSITDEGRTALAAPSCQ
jgi:hypothetical protein